MNVVGPATCHLGTDILGFFLCPQGNSKLLKDPPPPTPSTSQIGIPLFIPKHFSLDTADCFVRNKNALLRVFLGAFAKLRRATVSFVVSVVV